MFSVYDIVNGLTTLSGSPMALQMVRRNWAQTLNKNKLVVMNKRVLEEKRESSGNELMKKYSLLE